MFERGYPLENRSYQSDDINYKFTGKQRDSETGGACPDMLLIGNYFGARYYDARIGRWGGVDPLYTSLSLSPYNYANNCPLYFVDPDGRRIDPTGLGSYYDRWRKDLEYITGLQLFVNSEGNLDYRKDDNGNTIVSGGSETARKMLIEMIENEDVLKIFTKVGIGSKRNGNDVNLDPEQIQAFIDGTHGLNKSTSGWAMVFIHEARHTEIGGNFRDPETDFAQTQIGENEFGVNQIRLEMTKNGYGNWGERLQYWGIGNGNETCIPFDLYTKKGHFDMGNYICFPSKYNLKVE